MRMVLGVGLLGTLLGSYLALAGPTALPDRDDDESLPDPPAAMAAESTMSPRNAAEVPGRRSSRDLAALAKAAEGSYSEGAVFSRGVGDPIMYRGPFVLKKTPVLAEHKFPQDFGVPIHAVRRLRYYPFLAFSIYADAGDELKLLATNFVFNSLPIPSRDFLQVPEGGGLGYIEVPESPTVVTKFLVIRLADNTLKVTRLDAGGAGEYSVYCISGRAWAKYAHRYVQTDEPIKPLILPEELEHPVEGPHLYRLLAGYENASYTGYWTLPERDRVRGWGEIWMPRDLRVVDYHGKGSQTLRPIDVGAADITFEQGLTFARGGYGGWLRDYRWRLFYPQTEEELTPTVRRRAAGSE